MRLNGLVWVTMVGMVAACGDDAPKQIDAPPVQIDMPVVIDEGMNEACACATASPTPTKGSPIALTPDDATLVSVNKDVGTVTVARVDNTGATPVLTKVAELDVGGAGCEPTEVTIDACGKCAYVVNRQTQRVVRIENLATTPTVGPNVAVGSEPTAIAISPDNGTLYVANWVDGTISVINALAMTAGGPIDLNVTLAATNRLGMNVTPRPALAHPRDLAVSADGATLVATEFYAQREAPETTGGANADATFVGIAYKVATATNTASAIVLPAVTNTGFNDHNGAVTGCFPNQLSAVTIDGTRAWIASTCASPRGPLGVFTGGACTLLNQETACGVGGTCNINTLTCNPNPTDVKTTTHPAMSVIDLAADTATTVVLDKLFDTATSTRVPLTPTDIAFKSNFAYVMSAGTDAAFRLTTSNGTITDVGSATNKFINLRPPMDNVIRLPSGFAIGHGNAIAFSNNEGNRTITPVDLNTQSITGVALQASELPVAGTPADHVLKGKRFFFTGLGRWSLAGAGWGSCGACHPDGLSDNVTWYFGRGPRQSTSLDGSFATSDPADQRIFNWTAVFDEVADFEGNTRGTSGGVGALVTVANSPPTNADRINTAAETPPQQGLQGSSDEIGDPAGVSGHPHSVLSDWIEIKDYMKSIRSPRGATGFATADVLAGEMIFKSAAMGNCIGCHSGPKWTISKRFYTPGDGPNAATASAAANSLSNIDWSTNVNGFPAALFPSTVTGEQRMRFGNPPGAEQLQCILRPVGTFGISSNNIAVQEIRQDMVTAGQGNATNGRGFNPPSLLGLQVGGPFFHAGNARTLEELFNGRFSGHHQSAIASVFTPDPTIIRQLTAFMLSLDEATATAPIPTLGASGGDLCHL